MGKEDISVTYSGFAGHGSGEAYRVLILPTHSSETSYLWLLRFLRSFTFYILSSTSSPLLRTPGSLKHAQPIFSPDFGVSYYLVLFPKWNRYIGNSRKEISLVVTDQCKSIHNCTKHMLLILSSYTGVWTNLWNWGPFIDVTSGEFQEIDSVPFHHLKPWGHLIPTKTKNFALGFEGCFSFLHTWCMASSAVFLTGP